MTALRTPPVHDTLVARLKADLAPVHPLWSPAARLASWLLLVALVIGVAMAASLRHDLKTLGQPLHLLELATLLAAATAAASAAFHGAVPGRDGRRMAWLALVLSVASAVLLLAEPAVPSSGSPAVQSGLQCALCVTMFGLLPWVAILVAVRRGAPLEARTTGALAGLAAFVVGTAAVRVACPIDDSLHVLAWHMIPVLVWTTLSAALGAVWLARWRVPASRTRRVGMRG